MSRAWQRSIIWAGCIAALVGGVWLGPHTSVQGAGSENLRRGNDLTVSVDTRWAGGRAGGYYPIRVRITNTGRPRQLTARFQGYNVPTVHRTLVIEQNATQQFSLAIPLSGTSSHGEFSIIENGRELQSLTSSVSLPDPLYVGSPDHVPGLLVISPDPVDCDAFFDAANAVATGGASPSVAYGGYQERDAQVIPPLMLPESWLDYSGLDIVAIALPTLDKLPAPARTALLNWVETGGTLLVYNLGGPPADSRDLPRLLDLPSRAQAVEWHAANPELHVEVVIVSDPSVVVEYAGIDESDGSEDAMTEGAKLIPAAPRSWPSKAETFSSSRLMLGRVYAFAGNPFPGTASDWAWLLKSPVASQTSTATTAAVGQGDVVAEPASSPVDHSWWHWSARLGLNARQGHPEFGSFEIPGVGQVPVLAFLFVISVFSIVIGPVNYYVLHLRKQLFLLILTIPILAFVTTASLFAYAVVADGFSVQSRVRSFTLLDQGRKSAVTLGRVSLYAGVAPSAGLNFSPDTAVLPVWPEQPDSLAARVDWTNSQHLSSGWLRSRTLLQLATVAPRVERGRLDISPVSGAGANSSDESNLRLSVSNGFTTELTHVLVRDDQGRLFYGERVPAGGSAQLVPAVDSNFSQLEMLLTADQQVGVSAGSHSRTYPTSHSPYGGYYGGNSLTTFSHSLLEQNLQRLRRTAAASETAAGLPRKSYLAVLPQAPYAELGIPSTTPQPEFHVLHGLY